MKAFTVICLAVALASSSTVKADSGGADIDQLVQICNNNYAQFDRQLDLVRQTMVREIDEMSVAQYTTLLFESNPRIILTISTWPEIVRPKDEMWRAYRDCKDYHIDVRRELNSTVSTKALRKEAVLALKDCLFDRYREEVQPMKDLLACYEKQANR